MKLDEKRLNRQLAIVDKWVRNQAIGALEAGTGFGKTMVAILAIKRLHNKYPQAKIIVVLPSTKLCEDWLDKDKGHIAIHNLSNVQAFVVNTYITTYHQCDLLVLDEIHNYAADEFSKVFNQTEYKFLLGLTATLERNDGKHILVEELCPIIERISLEEAKREGYISNFKVYNLGLEFDEEDKKSYSEIHSMFNMNFAKFGHDFSLAMACTMGNNVRYKVGADIKTGGEWRSQLARSQGWDGTDDHFWSPRAIYKYAQQWSYAMRKRKEAIYNATVKLKTVKDIVNKLKVKTMIFCETADFANKVAKELGDIARVYHTKIESELRTIKKERVTKTKGTIITYVEKKVSGNVIKKENLEAFTNTEEILVLVTVRSLDEGFDFSKIALGIMASYNSSKRQDTQRTGRTVRKDEDNPDKCSLVVNLYIKDTQEEKWLKAKQLGKRGIIEIDSIDAISVEGNILEGSIKLT